MAPDLASDPRDNPGEDLDARQRAWRATRDPAVIWPDLDLDALQQAADCIGSVTARIINDGEGVLPRRAEVDARAFGIAGLVTGMGPLLGWWLERGMLDCDEDVAVVLREHVAHARLRQKRMTAGVSPALRALQFAGVTPAIIKGFHTSRRYFPDPATRPLADVDVVVDPSEIERAELALRTAGFSPSPRIEKPYKRNWYPPDHDGRVWSLELWHERSPWTLELHGGVSFQDLSRNGVRLDTRNGFAGAAHLAGSGVRVATEPLLVALLAVHLSTELHASRLLRVIELIFVARQDAAAGLLDWEGVGDLLARSHALRYAYPALALAEQLVPGTVAPAMLARASRASTAAAQRVVKRLTPTSSIVERGVSMSQRLMWATTPLQVARRLAAFVAPQPEADLRLVLAAYAGRARRFVTGHVTR